MCEIKCVNQLEEKVSKCELRNLSPDIFFSSFRCMKTIFVQCFKEDILRFMNELKKKLSFIALNILNSTS